MEINKQNMNEFWNEASKLNETEEIKKKVKRDLHEIMNSEQEKEAMSRLMIVIQLILSIQSNLPIEDWIKKYSIRFWKEFENSSNIKELKKNLYKTED